MMVAPHAVASPWRAMSASSHFHLDEPPTIGLVPWIGQAYKSPLRAISWPSHFHFEAELTIAPPWVPVSPRLAMSGISSGARHQR